MVHACFATSWGFCTECSDGTQELVPNFLRIKFAIPNFACTKISPFPKYVRTLFKGVSRFWNTPPPFTGKTHNRFHFTGILRFSEWVFRLRGSSENVSVLTQELHGSGATVSCSSSSPPASGVCSRPRPAAGSLLSSFAGES